MSKTPRTRLLLGHGNGTRKTRALVTISDFKSSGAEAFRTLRTNLIFSQAVQSLHRIVITSAFPSEGKTTTVANLAVTFAQQGLRVLIVDADLRRPRMHDVFHMTRVPGLTDVLIDQATLSGVVRETAVPNLFLLPAGLIAPNPAELLGNARTQQVLDKLNEQFDLVMLDAAPLLAVSDAMILGRMADGVLLVVRAGKTEKTAAQHAIQQLTNVGARVVGAVLNDPDAQVPKYSEYYGYGYTYYGASEDEERAQTPAATVENRG